MSTYSESGECLADGLQANQPYAHHLLAFRKGTRANDVDTDAAGLLTLRDVRKHEFEKKEGFVNCFVNEGGCWARPCELDVDKCEAQCRLDCDADPLCAMFEMSRDRKNCCMEVC